MKQHIISLPHHPKRVLIISLIIALAIGTFGYLQINKKVAIPVIKDNSSVDVSNNNPSSPQNLTLGFLVGGRIKSVSVKTGDIVKKGTVLAELDAGNVKGALIQAQAAYEKIINGATGTTIDIAKAAVNTATVNLNEITKQQNVLVDNAYRNLLNSTLEAVPSDNTQNYQAPTISGNYTLGKEGVINLHFYYSSGGISFTASGLSNGSGIMNGITSQPIGNSGLYIKSTSTQIGTEDWVIEIPNKKASNYLANYNAYQLALQNKNQAIDVAQATLDQANASLAGLVATARPEDVATAKGALEIAQAAYNNTIITAPSDGTVTSVTIAEGQIATPNAAAIELKTNY
jgi:multidrug efflux pump subunit AcrA (membrane-fusion protein)